MVRLCVYTYVHVCARVCVRVCVRVYRYMHETQLPSYALTTPYIWYHTKYTHTHCILYYIYFLFILLLKIQGISEHKVIPIKVIKHKM